MANGSFPINIGKDNLDKSKIFFKDLNIKNLEIYFDNPKTLAKILHRFKKNAKFSWCQEEPKNMGAWNSARNYIQWTLDYIKAENKEVEYIGRKPAASPASGYLKKHLAQQKEILHKVFN